jgi:hypothetical protein
VEEYRGSKIISALIIAGNIIGDVNFFYREVKVNCRKPKEFLFQLCELCALWHL